MTRRPCRVLAVGTLPPPLRVPDDYADKNSSRTITAAAINMHPRGFIAAAFASL